ncbi:hypothetical protein KPY62_13070 [Psychrobacter sp. TAE2020]|nr:hypothetical protein [Psychrobacter sp. TAE2020]MBU5618004.1 hypothetical protein [Psychrobacter sp. TAE2020]
MDASPAIGATIFFYIVAFIVVMIIGAYLTYQVSPSKREHRKAKRNKPID